VYGNMVYGWWLDRWFGWYGIMSSVRFDLSDDFPCFRRRTRYPTTTWRNLLPIDNFSSHSGLSTSHVRLALQHDFFRIPRYSINRITNRRITSSTRISTHVPLHLISIKSLHSVHRAHQGINGVYGKITFYFFAKLNFFPFFFLRNE